MATAWQRAACLLVAGLVGVPGLVLGCAPDDDGVFDEARPDAAEHAWSAPQLALLRSLSLASLRPPPPNPSNELADDPRAAELGHQIFFDRGLSANGQVSCATCHIPALFFSDGRVRSQGVGETGRNAPSVVATAYAPWLFWDGRRDSLWAQALAPLETDVEMASTRLEVVRRIAFEGQMAALYREVFGPPSPLGEHGAGPEPAGPFGDAAARAAWARFAPNEQSAINRIFADIGKALEAYQRLLVPAPGRFDRYVAAVVAGRTPEADAKLSVEEIAGLRLFIDPQRTLCLRCHNGPLLTNQAFHRIGTSAGASGLPDFGRFLGLQAVLLDPFNCAGAYSDAAPDECGELRYLKTDHIADEIGKFKTPSLRGLAKTAPYMHDGRFATLAEVVEHYRRPPPVSGTQHELTPLDLSDEDVDALVAFLRTLGDEVAVEPRWLENPIR